MFSNNRAPPALAAALVAVLVAGCSRGAAEPHARAEPVIPVVTAPAQARTVPVIVHAVGSVEPVASVAILSRVDGPIERVFVADGQDVAANQPLIQIDPEPLRLQVRVDEANLERDIARADDARAKEERGRALLDQHFISSDDYAQLKTNLASAAATVDADRATLDQARLQLAYTTIRAPVAGKLGHVALQVGNMVHASSSEPLTTLNVIDTVDVSFTVPERTLQAVRRAHAAHQAMVSVTETDGAVDVRGALTFIDNTVDRASGTLHLRARVDNKDHVLWPGEFVTVNLSLGEDRDVIVVPSIAIQQGPKGPYVFVIRQDSAAEQRAVHIARVADDVTIVSGVKASEHVVIDGQSRLTPGTRVSVRSERT